MIINDILKETLKNKLAKSSGKPYNENYNSGHRYGSIVITKKGNQHCLDWELVDRGGELVDFLKREYNSFDKMWVDLEKVLKIK